MWIWKLRVLALVCGVAFSPTRLLGEDLERGAYLFGVCAACHGAHGEGGGAGVYPRIAGFPSAYIADQLRAFKKWERLNVAMVTFASDRELPESAILELSTYIASLTLVTRPVAPVGATGAALPRDSDLPGVDIPRAPGDVEVGSATYTLACARCHGPRGWGDATVPQLAGQHTRYLATQIEQYVASKRTHPETELLFSRLSDSKIQDILAYLSTLEDPGDAHARNR